MADAKKCDICGGYYDLSESVLIKTDTCSVCGNLIESFIESLKEGTLSVGLLDYLISVHGEEGLKEMLEQRGDTNGRKN